MADTATEPDRIPVVYIAGPYRGPTAWVVAEHVRKAERVALRVAKMGAMPLCPHSMCAHYNGTLTDQFWLAGTSELLRRCDAILMISGWMDSHGSLAELALARKVGIPFFFYMDPLRAWIAKWTAEEPDHG